MEAGGQQQQRHRSHEGETDYMGEGASTRRAPDNDCPAVRRRTQSGDAGAGALEGKGPQRRPQKRFYGRLEEVAKAVGGGCCRLHMPLKLALGVNEKVAGHRLGALEGWVPFPLPMHPSASGG